MIDAFKWEKWNLTLMAFASKSRSTIFRSLRSIPAWWIPNPSSNSCLSSLFLDCPISRRKRSQVGWSWQLKSSSTPSAIAASFRANALFTVSFRAWTKTITWWPSATRAATFSYVTLSRFLRACALPGLPFIPRKCCSRGTGRKDESK